MIQQFASGYYMRTYWIEAAKKSRRYLTINSQEYSQLKNKIYDESPVVFKIGKKHYFVRSDENIPAQTIKIGSDELEDLSIDRIPDKKEVLLLKPELTGVLF